MIKFNREFKRENKFAQMLNISFCVAITTVFFILGASSWTKAQNEVNSSYEHKFENAALVINNEMERLDYVAALISENTWVDKLLDYSSSDFEAMSVTDKNIYLKDMKVYNSFLGTNGDIALYFKNADMIITSSEICDYDWYYNKAFHLNNYSSTEYHQLLAQSKKDYLGLQMVETYDYKRMLNIYIRSLPLVSDDLAIVVSTDKGFYENILYAFIDADSEQYQIIQKGNNIVMSESISDKKLKSELDKNVNANPASYKKFSLDFNNDKFALNVYVGKSLSIFKILIISIIPVAFLYLVVMVLGLLIIRSLHAAYIKRIKKLNSLFLETSSNEADLNSEALIVLENHIHEIICKENALKKDIESESGKIKSTYLNMLLRGRLEQTEESARTLEFLNVDLKSPCFLCLLPMSDISNGFDGRLSDYDQTEILYFENSWVYIVFGDNSVREQWIQLSDQKLKDFKDIYGGVGGVCSGIFQIACSYQQAKFACEYAALLDRQILVKYIPEFSNSKVCRLDSDYISNLISNLLNRKLDKYVLQIQEFCANVQKEPYNPSSVHIAFKEIWNVISNLATEKRIQVDESKLDASKMSIFKFGEEALKYGANIIEQLSKQKDAAQSQYFEEIRNYIDENITNPALSLKLLSEHFYVSNSYISRFFLENSGVNFLEYIQNRRIELSKQLLIEDQKSIDAIAEKVGFENSVTFRRVFKNRVGMTPSDYRIQKVKN